MISFAGLAQARRCNPSFLDRGILAKRYSLIAIMLGRFRMSVLDCIEEYQKLGEGVFGHPRLACTLRFGVGNRSRYKAESLEDVFKDVAARRDEYCQDPVPAIRFPSERGVCQT